jgi:hypothetical protein
MPPSTFLKNFNIVQLNALLKHVRLGLMHLKKILNPQELENLFERSEITPKQHKNMKADAQEKAGNISILSNTLITSILGIWLGLSGFIGLGLKSVIILTLIVIITMITCGWVGYASFKLTAKKATDSLQQKKLHLLEIEILKELTTKHTEELNQTIEDITSALCNLDLSLKKSLRKQHNLTKKLQNHLKNTSFYQYIERITHKYLPKSASLNVHPAVKNKIDQLLAEITALKQAELTIKASAQQKTTTKEFDKSENNNYLKKLTTPSNIDEPIITSQHQWLKSNIIDIITGIAPTLLGSFASMFVFLTGVPEILQAFNINAKGFLQHQTAIQIICISCAFLLALYYCYAYLHSNHKNFLRSRELKKTEKQIAEANDQLSTTVTQLNKLRQIKSIVQELAFLHLMIKTFEQKKR